MGPPKYGAKKRRQKRDIPDFPAPLTECHSMPTTPHLEGRLKPNDMSPDRDSDTAYGFDNNWGAWRLSRHFILFFLYFVSAYFVSRNLKVFSKNKLSIIASEFSLFSFLSTELLKTGSLAADYSLIRVSSLVGSCGRYFSFQVLKGLTGRNLSFR